MSLGVLKDPYNEDDDCWKISSFYCLREYNQNQCAATQPKFRFRIGKRLRSRLLIDPNYTTL